MKSAYSARSSSSASAVRSRSPLGHSHHTLPGCLAQAAANSAESPIQLAMDASALKAAKLSASESLGPQLPAACASWPTSRLAARSISGRLRSATAAKSHLPLRAIGGGRSSAPSSPSFTSESRLMSSVLPHSASVLL